MDDAEKWCIAATNCIQSHAMIRVFSDKVYILIRMPCGMHGSHETADIFVRDIYCTNGVDTFFGMFDL